MFTVRVNKCVMLGLRLIPRQQTLGYAKYVRKTREELAEELKKKRFGSMNSIVTSALKNRKTLTAEEWKSVEADLEKHNLLRGGNSFQRNVFAILLKLGPPYDSLKIAKGFIETNSIENDLSLKQNMIRLYAKKAAQEKLSEKDEQELLEFCNVFIVKEMHAMPGVHSLIINGLCATKEWKKAMTLPYQTYESLNILIRKSLRQNEIDLVWGLLDGITRMHKNFRKLTNKTIYAFVNYFRRHPADISQKLEKVLSYCEKLENLLDEPSTRQLVDLLSKHDHHAHITTIDYSGTCAICKSTLQSVGITDKEYLELKDEFIKNVVNGADIYHKTTPAEWESFEQMLHKNPPFDIVMDGLNVAYCANVNNLTSRIQRPCAHSLADVVTQLANEGKRVLVIGRKHMERWPKIDYIEQKATVFLVDNLSKDDIFLLYAAIHSGKYADILSHDYMRQHKFAIGYSFEAIFKKWQQQHWYEFSVAHNEKLKLYRPMQFKMYTHKTSNGWHLPFRTNEEAQSKTSNRYGLPKHWACVRLKEKK